MELKSNNRIHFVGKTSMPTRSSLSSVHPSTNSNIRNQNIKSCRPKQKLAEKKVSHQFERRQNGILPLVTQGKHVRSHGQLCSHRNRIHFRFNHSGARQFSSISFNL